MREKKCGFANHFKVGRTGWGTGLMHWVWGGGAGRLLVDNQHQPSFYLGESNVVALHYSDLLALDPSPLCFLTLPKRRYPESIRYFTTQGVLFFRR